MNLAGRLSSERLNLGSEQNCWLSTVQSSQPLDSMKSLGARELCVVSPRYFDEVHGWHLRSPSQHSGDVTYRDARY